MLWYGAQRELDLGHRPSPYCKALGAIAVVRMLLHVLADFVLLQKVLDVHFQQCCNVGY